MNPISPREISCFSDSPYGVRKSIYNFHDIYMPGVDISIHHIESYQRFLHSCTLLPLPPVICSMKFGNSNKIIYRGVNTHQEKYYAEIKQKLLSEAELNDAAIKRMEDLENGEGMKPSDTVSTTGDKDDAKSDDDANSAVDYEERLKLTRKIIEYSACGQHLPSSSTNIFLPSMPSRIMGRWVFRQGGNDGQLSSLTQNNVLQQNKNQTLDFTSMFETTTSIPAFVDNTEELNAKPVMNDFQATQQAVVRDLTQFSSYFGEVEEKFEADKEFEINYEGDDFDEYYNHGGAYEPKFSIYQTGTQGGIVRGRSLLLTQFLKEMRGGRSKGSQTGPASETGSVV